MSNHKKYNIVLDLDNTLISAIPLEEFSWDKATKKKSMDFDGIHHMENYYIIFERPHLQEFLDFLFKNFNVSVWSAASKDYVLYIIKNVICKELPERQLDYIFFSYHCNWSKQECKELKGLGMLWDNFNLDSTFNKNNTILIDDLPENCKNQVCNTIQVHPFEFEDEGSEKDKELKEVQNKLKNLLSLKDLSLDTDICLTKNL